MTVALVEQAVAASGAFTPWVELRGTFNASITGSWTGTVTVQRSFDGGATVRDVDQFAANIERVGEEPEAGASYRIGFKTGDYTSGSANVRISK